VEEYRPATRSTEKDAPGLEDIYWTRKDSGTSTSTLHVTSCAADCRLGQDEGCKRETLLQAPERRLLITPPSAARLPQRLLVTLPCVIHRVTQRLRVTLPCVIHCVTQRLLVTLPSAAPCLSGSSSLNTQ